MKSILCLPSSTTFLAIVTAALGLQASLRAATLVTNASNSNDGITLLSSTYATSFTTGSDPGWTLDSVGLELTRESGSFDNQAVNVTIASDNGGVPGVSFSSLSGPTIPVGTGVNHYTFTPDSAVILAPNTTYWITAQSSGAPVNDGVIWQGTNSLGETGESGWSIGNSRYVLGGEWTEVSSNSTYQMTISGTAVPEPSGALLAGLGMLSIALRRRRA